MDQGNPDPNNQNPSQPPVGMPPAPPTPAPPSSGFGLDSPAPMAPSPEPSNQSMWAPPQADAPLTPPSPEPQGPSTFQFQNPGAIGSPEPPEPPAPPQFPEPAPMSSAEPSLGGDQPIVPIPPQPSMGSEPAAPTAFNPFTPQESAQAPQGTENETTPTDLSNLVAGTSTGVPSYAETPTGTAPVPESLVVPTPVVASTDANQVVAGQPRSGFPKWIIIIAVLVILGVAGASAYFILGIGKPQEPVVNETPATEQTTIPKSLVPTETPSTESSSFGTFTGDQTATGSGSNSGSSAYQMLKQRQSTGSATR